MASAPRASTHVRNLDETVVNVSAGACHVTDIVAANTTGAAAFVQVFDLAAADVTLGTTRPLFVIALAATTGWQHLSFSEGVVFDTRFSAASTTAAEGSTGSADGVFVQAWVK